MLTDIRDRLRLLTPQQRRRLLLMQVLTDYYLSRDLLYHAVRNSSALASRAVNDTERVSRLFMTLAISGMVVIVLLYASGAGGVTAALPVSGLFAMAGYKLLPTFQQRYHALTEMRSARASFEAIRDDLLRSEGTAPAPTGAPLVPTETMELRQVGVHYDGRPEAVLSSVDLTLPVGKTTIILGPSGGGKSTILELLLGLIPPTEGDVLIDGRLPGQEI